MRLAIFLSLAASTLVLSIGVPPRRDASINREARNGAGWTLEQPAKYTPFRRPCTDSKDKSLDQSQNQLNANKTLHFSAEEQRLHKLINDYRNEHKLAPIPLSAKLSQVAQAHVYDLAMHYSGGPVGKCNLHSWSPKGKWSPCCYTGDHKEAACMWKKPREIAGYNSEGFEIAYSTSLGASADSGVNAWKGSPGHNDVMINRGPWARTTWKAMGTGVYKQFAVAWFGKLEDVAPGVEA